MYNSRDVDPLMREKENATRSQPLRGYSHRRTPLSRTHSDGHFTARTPSGGMFGRSSNDYHPFERRRSGSGDFPQPWRSMSPSRRRAFSASEQHSGAYQRITFEQAIAGMLSALKYASEGLQELETTFSHDVAALSLWLPPQHVDSLWSIYTTWNGLHAGLVKHSADRKADGSKPPHTTTYVEVIHRISNALTGLRQCCSPDALALSEDHHGQQRSSHPGFSTTKYANSGAAGLGWHVLRTTMRKLEISFEAIEELAVLVRMQRERLPALRHEVCAAVQLLEGIQSMTCAGKGKGKAAMGDGYSRHEEDEEEEEEHDWPDCGSI